MVFICWVQRTELEGAGSGGRIQHNLHSPISHLHLRVRVLSPDEVDSFTYSNQLSNEVKANQFQRK